MDEQARASLMREGIAAAQQGQREQAYQLFSQLTADDNNNANAWIWLSATSDDPDEALAAAHHALTLEPNNEFAQQAERFALQAQEERSQSEPAATTQQAQAENAAEATAAATTALPAATQTDRSLIPPFLTQEMAAQNPPPATVTPVTTRPSRSFTSRLEERTAVKADQREIDAARRRQTLTTLAIVLAALLVLAAVIYLVYTQIGSQGNNSHTAQAEATATPLPSPTNIPAMLRVTATVLAQANATATAAADVLDVTATAVAQAQVNAQQTFTAQTFPTAVPGPALLAYNQGLDAYNRQQYPQAAAALEQAVQIDRHSVLANYYLGLTDLQLAQAPIGQNAALTPTLATALTSSTTTPISSPAIPISGTTTPISGTTAPSAAASSSADYYARAISAFRNVTSLAPNWAGGYAGLADTYLRQGRYADALTYAQQAVNLDNGRPEYYLLLGRIYDGLGRRAEAKAAYDAAAGLAPPIPGATPFPTPTNAPPIPTTPPVPATATPASGEASATALAPTAPPASADPQPPTATPQSAAPQLAVPTPTSAGMVITVVVPLSLIW